jgi:polysaccharide chain length determinant protein (PEP-CTERM system associated)
MPPTQATNSWDRKVRIDRVVAVLRRRVWLMVAVGVAALTATLSLVLFLPDVYRSSATVLVERQRVPDDLVRSTITREVSSRLQEISQQVMSRASLVPLIEKHDLYSEMRKTRPIDDVVQHMRKDVWLELQGSSHGSSRDGTVAFSITYTGTEPKTVAQVANEIAEIYVQEDLRVRNRQAAQAADFLAGELEDMKTKLETQEQAVKNFKERYMGELPQQETANLSTLERLSAQLLLNNEKQVLARERLIVLEKQVAASEEAAGEGGTRLEAALRELADLRKQYTERYPDVVRLRQEVAELQLEAAAENGDETEASRSGRNAGKDRANGVRALDAELKVLRAEEKRLQRVIAEYEERIESTPRREQEFHALRRDYETTQQVYQSLLKRYEEAKMAESLEQNQRGEQFRMLDPALIAERPVAPRRMRLLLIGILLSVGLVAVVAAAAENLDPAIHTVDELRALSTVPVLATIPRIVTEADQRWNARRLWLGAASTVAGIVVIVVVAYLVADQNTRLSAFLS